MDFRLARDGAELAQARELRSRVFSEEQGVHLDDLHPDGLHDALQVVAIEDGLVVGTCRVLLRDDVAWLGRLAVEPVLRRRGVGQGVLAAAESAARTAGCRLMRLHSQDYVEPMYLDAGYARFDEPFVEQGVPHVSMEKVIA